MRHNTFDAFVMAGLEGKTKSKQWEDINSFAGKSVDGNCLLKSISVFNKWIERDGARKLRGRIVDIINSYIHVQKTNNN